MPTYVTLYKYTDKGIGAIKDAPKRVDANTKAAAQAGVTVKEALWLQGEWDFLTITEAADEAIAMAMGVMIAQQGNVRSQTMRAFTKAEMEKILAKVS